MTILPNAPDKTLWLRGVCIQNGLPVSDEQLSKLEEYVRMLLEWNKSINLISRKDEYNVWENHILHSISLLFKVFFLGQPRILDFGTGGGLPGIPLKILLPEATFVLMDATNKKIRAVEDMISRLDLKEITTIWGRGEELSNKHGLTRSFDAVVVRAVAHLADISKIASSFLRKRSAQVGLNENRDSNSTRLELNSPALIVYKGGDTENEVSKIRNHKNLAEIHQINLFFKGSAEAGIVDKKLVIVTFNK